MLLFFSSGNSNKRLTYNLELLEAVCAEESDTHHTLKMLLVFGE